MDTLTSSSPIIIQPRAHVRLRLVHAHFATTQDTHAPKLHSHSSIADVDFRTICKATLRIGHPFIDRGFWFMLDKPATTSSILALTAVVPGDILPGTYCSHGFLDVKVRGKHSLSLELTEPVIYCVAGDARVTPSGEDNTDPLLSDDEIDSIFDGSEVPSQPFSGPQLARLVGVCAVVALILYLLYSFVATRLLAPYGRAWEEASVVMAGNRAIITDVNCDRSVHREAFPLFSGNAIVPIGNGALEFVDSGDRDVLVIPDMRQTIEIATLTPDGAITGLTTVAPGARTFFFPHTTLSTVGRILFAQPAGAFALEHAEIGMHIPLPLLCSSNPRIL